MNKLKKWLISATKAEIRELAEKADTSKAYINKIANGLRNASPYKAGRIADAAKQVELLSDDWNRKRLPRLTRGDLSNVCRKCDYYVKCHKED